MKETGIIMSGHHPVDILEGRKTMTRRTYGLSIINDPPQRDSGWQLVAVFQDGCARFATPSGGDITLQCPYGGYGDRLWVKERHYLYSTEQTPKGVIYYADAGKSEQDNAVWRPSIFLPRWASRILLEITEIRVEKLQEITLFDIYAEGCLLERATIFTDPENGYQLKSYAYEWYHDLWNSLNKKRGYSFESNPRVWCLQFKVVKE